MLLKSGRKISQDKGVESNRRFECLYMWYFRYSGLGGPSDKKMFLLTLEEGKKLAMCICWEEGSRQGKSKSKTPSRSVAGKVWD